MDKNKQKNVLSVRDFSILYSLIIREISNMETHSNRIEYYRARNMSDEEIKEERQQRNQALKENAVYQDLLRIREKLGKLNIEIDTPIVEVKNESN